MRPRSQAVAKVRSKRVKPRARTQRKKESTKKPCSKERREASSAEDDFGCAIAQASEEYTRKGTKKEGRKEGGTSVLSCGSQTHRQLKRPPPRSPQKKSLTRPLTRADAFPCRRSSEPPYSTGGRAKTQERAREREGYRERTEAQRHSEIERHRTAINRDRE